MYIIYPFPNNHQLKEKKLPKKKNYKPPEANENESLAFEYLWCASKPTLRGAGNNHIKKISNQSPTTLTKVRRKSNPSKNKREQNRDNKVRIKGREKNQ